MFKLPAEFSLNVQHYIVGDEYQLEYDNKDGGNHLIKILVGTWDSDTETLVTPIKINSARRRMRKPTQEQVMGISSNTISRSDSR